MENPCLFLNITLAVLADSIEVGQGGWDIKSLNPLGLAVVIVVVGLIICFGAWVKHILVLVEGSENSTKRRIDPENETSESHK
jgi:hypothetical protein